MPHPGHGPSHRFGRRPVEGQDRSPRGAQEQEEDGKHALILPNRYLASFLGSLSDDISLSNLLLPGTHESIAYYGYPISQCQSPSFPLATQLRSGIRLLDIRLAVVKNPHTDADADGILVAFHGIISQRVTFSDILAIVYAFLTSQHGSSECIIMSIKQEDSKASGQHFSSLVKQSVFEKPHLWFLERRIPNLGEVRGKIVLFSRFNDHGAGWPRGDDGMGIQPPIWPDSQKDGFEWDCAHTHVRTHDWYSIPSFLSIPEKFERSTSILVKPKSDSAPEPEPEPSGSGSGSGLGSSPTTLSISYTSASSIPLALPPMIASGFHIGWGKFRFGYAGVNERVRNWIGQWMIVQRQSQSQSQSQGRDRDCEAENKDKKDSSDGGGIIHRSDRDRPCGWVLMDFADEPKDLVALMIECNFL